MLPRMLRGVTLISLLLVAGGALACAPFHVNAFTETGTRFSSRTYAWAADAAVPTGDPRLDNNRFFSERVRGSVDRELAARGFEQTALGSSDRIVHFHATIGQEVVPSRAADRVEHCYDCGPTVYDAGTLVVDLVDAHTNRLLWRGWAERVDPVIDNQDWMEETIDRVVAAIM